MPWVKRVHVCRWPDPEVLRIRRRAGIGSRWRCRKCGQVWELSHGRAGCRWFDVEEDT